MNNKKLVPVYKVLTQKSGVNSEILLHHYYRTEQNQVVIKFGASKGGFDFQEAQLMMQHIIDYQKELERYQIPIPPIEDIFLEFHPLKQRAIIVKISPW